MNIDQRNVRHAACEDAYRITRLIDDAVAQNNEPESNRLMSLLAQRARATWEDWTLRATTDATAKARADAMLVPAK